MVKYFAQQVTLFQYLNQHRKSKWEIADKNNPFPDGNLRFFEPDFQGFPDWQLYLEVVE